MPLKLKDETWIILPVAPKQWRVNIKGLPAENVGEEDLKKILKSRGLEDNEIQDILNESLMDGEIRAQVVESQGFTAYLAEKVGMALKLLAPLVALGDWRVMNAINILQSKIKKVVGEEKKAAEPGYVISELIKALENYRQRYEWEGITKQRLYKLLLDVKWETMATTYAMGVSYPIVSLIKALRAFPNELITKRELDYLLLRLDSIVMQA